MCKKIFKQRGQALVFYALLVPLLLLFAGVGLDLGWYYLNVSRLQNAADAAALAGAQAIINDNVNFPTVTNEALLVSNRSFDPDRIYEGITDGEKETVAQADVLAEEYAVKNLGSVKDVNFGTDTLKAILDSWSKSKNDSDRVVTPTYSMYDYGTSFYYVVRLEEKIEHFFMPGWFPSMDAPVVAVAKLAQTPKMPTIINSNVIVGNWEVQDWYRKNNGTQTDSDGNKYTLFSQRYGYDLYTGAWNHFQDFFNHYATGAFYRTETVVVRDDVVAGETTDAVGNPVPVRYGTNSSVAATTASINTDKKSAAYNPQVNSVRKTYKEGVNDTGNVGLPYMWDRLDSINIDFKPETTFTPKSHYVTEETNWDLEYGYSDGVGVQYRKYASGSNNSEVDKMRIHNSINFEEPYKERPNAKEHPDILWCRIESEPILFYPDKVNGYTKSNVGLKRGMSSVRQIIINANKSNYDYGETKYRPVIIFYDGPETYDKSDPVRASQPVIFNLNAPFRGVLYAPNSPVCVIGSTANQNAFRGFVVAESYVRLKNDEDFIEGGVRYFENATRKNEYFKYVDANGNVTFKDAGDTVQTKKENGKNVNKTEEDCYKVEYYYAADDTKETKTKYYKVTDENGIDMYVDEYGNVQYAKLNNPPTKYGEYDNFGRTDFSTHDYHVHESSATNMLLSGD